LLDESRGELARASTERERWLNEMVAQARSSGDAPAALAQFISELRSEIIALRAHNAEADRRLAAAGLTPPLMQEVAARPVPRREPDAVEAARKLWAEGRLGEPVEATAPTRPPPPATGATSSAAEAPPLTRAPSTLPRAVVPGAGAEQRGPGAAARALTDQCLRTLNAADASRREQAARHLAAVALPAAAPALANALGAEREPKVRGQLAKALMACGREGAAEIVAKLQSPEESPLVRMAAAEALSTVPSRAREALQIAALDSSPAVRRRAAALAAAGGFDDLLARLENDEDSSVRAATGAAQSEGPPPAPEKDPSHEALHAVQAAIFGLTEAELAQHIGMPEKDAVAVAARLVAQGRLTRRGKRLVSAQGGAL
jgi:HEAT repeats